MKNKFIIISSCLITLCLTTIKAQEDPSLRRVEFGFRFMPTFSSFDMTTSSGGVVKGNVTLGYGAGALVGLNLTNHVGIQGEVLYSSLSQKYKDQSTNREINVRYVNIPLLFSLNTGISKPVNFKVVFGPQLGLNVGSTITTAGGDTLTTVLSTKKGDFGFAYGAGLGFSLNSSHTIRFDIGYRGVYGVVNISNTGQTNSTNSYYILNRAAVRTNSAYVGLTFCF